MTSDRIVIPLDVIEGFQFRFADITENAVVQKLCLVPRKQAFGVGVVLGFSGSAHALLKAVSSEQSAKFGVCILASAIAWRLSTVQNFNFG